MKIYAISGLGANQLVFEKLKLDAELIYIPWKPTDLSETLVDYAKKMADSVDASEPFGLMGFSFGGMLCSEINKILCPQHTFLISSVACRSELPFWIRFVSNIGIAKLLPAFCYTSPDFIKIKSNSISTEAGLDVLGRTRGNQTPDMVKAFTIKMLYWNNEKIPDNITRIHGDRDRLLPSPKAEHIQIRNAGHFAIVENAQEISHVINQTLATI